MNELVDGPVTVHVGDALSVLRQLPSESVHCVVTSPPYWQLRCYGTPGEIGSELTPEEYVGELTQALVAVRRVLKPDGTLWLNIGDSYAASGKGGGGSLHRRTNWSGIIGRKGFRMPPPGYKMKDLTLTPFKVAEAVRQSGWYLRSCIVWSKGVPSEPPRLDRPATSHEYLFLLAKSEGYRVRNPGPSERWWNATVWTVAPDFEADHSATMPEELVRRCLVCSTVEGDTVLDPFAGSGTSLAVARRLGRKAVGIELQADYLPLIRKRIEGSALPLLEIL